ncbi:hypothetical protein ALP58_102918 [Pseudomonas savastanoi]|uniref:Uncharacterized protein n=9 Tax=Pseudomonas syringae group TaxID=136849 RepID=A0A3M5ZE20_PSESS|nr:hypothetical protein ALO79_100904 [Pseudomonas syringae pv. castaneae]KPX04374.1 hypothetical protein ALO73_103205 [Pseudomonas syringae pv. daphniphylli]KPX06067.1 hypothetical protein ALO74_102937 [Pseudomonas syringae pv. cunninghamiae]KPX22342.1 hypothetical protein ALO70_102944 [Pseudomonas amygdali pv. eriobotryae]KPX77685.1 hypothetical protein ALO53_103136 [Pseudomonas amygdali pv. photiniae]KPZ10952.1 hypothetical protein ALO41_102941 [Pseudomonas amygdali pv. ulmi]RMP14906.1 hypo
MFKSEKPQSPVFRAFVKNMALGHNMFFTSSSLRQHDAEPILPARER